MTNSCHDTYLCISYFYIYTYVYHIIHIYIVSLEIIQIWRSIPEKNPLKLPDPNAVTSGSKGMPFLGPRKKDWSNVSNVSEKSIRKKLSCTYYMDRNGLYRVYFREYLGNKLPSSTRRFSSWNWITWRTSWWHDSEPCHFTSVSLAFQRFYSRFQVLVVWDTLLTSAPSQPEKKKLPAKKLLAKKGGSSRGEGW